MEWWRTSPDGEEKALKELTQPKLGRKARRDGTIETLISIPKNLEYLLSDHAMEHTRQILLGGNNRIGLQNAIQLWEEAFSGKAKPDNPDGAFIAFCKKIA